MIAVAGLARLTRGERVPGRAIMARAQWPLASLTPPPAPATNGSLFTVEDFTT